MLRFRAANDLGTKKIYEYNPQLMHLDVSSGWSLILVVNRHPNAQTLQVFENGTLLYTWSVSTGLEAMKAKKSGAKKLAHTPLGRFQPFRMHKTYTSLTWEESMPNAIFFNGGVAFHAAATPQAQRRIGQRASAGCVRLMPVHSQLLFDLVKSHFSSTLVVIEERSD